MLWMVGWPNNADKAALTRCCQNSVLRRDYCTVVGKNDRHEVVWQKIARETTRTRTAMHQMQAQSFGVGRGDDGALVFEQGFDKILVLAKAQRLEWMLHGGRASIHIRKSVKHDEIRADLTPVSYLEWAKRWVETGASIIGGCCGITPEHIAELSRALK